MTSWFEVAALVIGGGSIIVAALTTAAVVLGRLLRTGRRYRWEERDDKMRPLLLSVLDGDTVVVTARGDRRHLIELAVRASHNVRGTDRDTIVLWLRTAGTLHEARRLLRSRSAIKRAHGIRLYLPIADGRSRVLERLLFDRDPAVRAMACEALGRAASLETIPTLLAATGVGGRRIPAVLTAMAITRMMPPHAGLVLDPAAALTLPVQILALELVGILNLTDGRRAIEQFLSSSESDLRIAALGTLGQLSLPASAAALMSHRAIDPTEQAALATARLAMPTSIRG